MVKSEVIDIVFGLRYNASRKLRNKLMFWSIFWAVIVAWIVISIVKFIADDINQ